MSAKLQPAQKQDHQREERSTDGDVAQHPVHDSDQEDRGPEDFEEEIEELEEIAKVDSAVRS